MHDLQPKAALGSGVVFVIGNAYHVHQAARCSVLHAASGDKLQVTPCEFRMYFEVLIDLYWSVTFSAQCEPLLQRSYLMFIVAHDGVKRCG